MTRQLSKWDLRFLDLAEHISHWSKDPTTQVGCVIADENHVVIGMGFNGFPQGSPDKREVLMDRAKKRLRTIHAEMNALHFATKSVEGATIYTTHHPCAACTANLLQHKPKEIVIPKSNKAPLGLDWEESLNEARSMLEEHGVEVIVI
jgi:dCMP deaminase